MSEMITSASECSVKIFMACAFEEKYHYLHPTGTMTDDELKSIFSVIYSEYVDIAGLYVTREFELNAYIASLDNRLRVVQRFIDAQRVCIQEFGRPFPALDLVAKYGHALAWDDEKPNKDYFLQRLNSMEVKEKRYLIEMNGKIKELVDLRKKRIKGEYNVLESRREFIKMLNRLQQNKYVIDRNETDMETVALMIKEQRDLAESNDANQKLNKSKKRY